MRIDAGSLDAAADRFFDDTAELMLREDPRLALLRPNAAAPDQVLRRTAAVRDRVWSMQPSMTLGVLKAGLETVRRHPVPEDREIVPLHALRTCPLYPSVVPDARYRSVPGSLMITEKEHLFVAGPSGTRLQHSIWESTDPGLVGRALEIHEAMWRDARPLASVTDRPLLEGRRLAVALLLAEGWGDKEVAAQLGTGVRTVSAEVRHVIQWLGARSRNHAVALLVGAGG